MKTIRKILEAVLTPFTTLAILLDESRRGGVDGTNCYDGGEHR